MAGGSAGAGSANNSFTATLASLADLSPVGASGSRTPNEKRRISQGLGSASAASTSQAAMYQSMRVIPSPFANSPAGYLETSFLASPIKGYGLGLTPGAGGSTSIKGSSVMGSESIFGGVSLSMPGSALRSGYHLPGGEIFDGGGTMSQSEVDFFVPAEVNRDRNTVDNMRIWRTDAMEQHMYKTAAYWGDKVLSITDDVNDVFWLCQVYYLMGEYPRAINLLQRFDLLESSIACRLLAIQCMIRSEKWTEALEYLGEDNFFSSKGHIGPNLGGLEIEASLCCLRGLVFKNMNNMVRAKECFKEALQIDVKCYEALDVLISNDMLTSNEERELIDGLEFYKRLQGPDAEFVKMLYKSKLKKFENVDEQDEIYSVLSTKFQAENADLLYSRADIYFTQCRFDKCLECTKKILEMDKYNLACMPMHLVSLYELDLKNDLFYIAHELVDRHPKEAVAWFAVGVYYYLTKNMSEARRYFGKASSTDRHYGPAWIGFGHSFAMEGEHDQAISAYATSSKLFQGSHLGAMYLGMQHLQQNNVLLAQKYLTSCLTICDSDPLLLNELGVMYYNMGQYEEAVQSFLKVIEKLQRSQRKNVIWETTWLNLAHAYRKLENYSEAEKYFYKVDAISNPGPAKASALVGLGFIYQIMGRLSDAIESYHKVLTIRSTDQIATEMLQRVMDEKVRASEMEWMQEYLPEEMKDDAEVERRVRQLDNSRARTRNKANSALQDSISRSGRGVITSGKRKASLSHGSDGIAGVDTKGKMKKTETEGQVASIVCEEEADGEDGEDDDDDAMIED
ncbi:anaphase promoting complex subunit cdc16 [Mortierella polycephala]|uniref:Anaphase promoting complex subunit cdc16 n=1 Tax=Mortierella polycephala TaxID=41804 RepID=A0A9P6UAP3_9FUNG|nr:anaphase promoting complex subunit cdc16 [Mortierella polycephala]